MTEEKQAATTFGLMKYVHLTFVAGGVFGAWLLSRIIDVVWTTLNLRFVAVAAPNVALVIAVSAGFSAAVAFYLWRHPGVNRLVVEIVTELSKVTWPGRKELYASTVVVIIVSIIAAIILGLFDGFWSWVTGFIY